MWTYNYSPENVLYHHGIKGQRWGVRRYQNEDGSLTNAGKKRYTDVISDKINEIQNKEKDYRKKLTTITNRKDINSDDRRLFEYRNKSLGARYAEKATGIIATRLISECVTGKIGRYSRMSKSELAKELTRTATRIATKTAATVALNDALAKSAAKGYTNEGKRADGKKDNRFITKERATMIGVKAAVLVAPYAKAIGKMTLNQAIRNRAYNEARFKSWGQNILTDQVSDYSNFINLGPDSWKIVE